MKFLEGFDTSYVSGADDLRREYYDYINKKYYEWVKEHDHEFIAERIGPDLEACRDNEVNYKISLSK